MTRRTGIRLAVGGVGSLAIALLLLTGTGSGAQRAGRSPHRPQPKRHTTAEARSPPLSPRQRRLQPPAVVWNCRATHWQQHRRASGGELFSRDVSPLLHRGEALPGRARVHRDNGGTGALHHLHLTASRARQTAVQLMYCVRRVRAPLTRQLPPLQWTTSRWIGARAAAFCGTHASIPSNLPGVTPTVSYQYR